MNILLDTWAMAMWRACWQGGLVVLVVWSICRLLPSMPARCQCWLWRLAVLKFMVALLVPWFFSLPLLPAQRVPEPAEIPMLVPAIQISHEELTPRAAMPMPLPATPPPPIPILPATLFLAWTLGLGWSFIRLVTSWRDVRRLRRKGHAADDPSLAEQVAIQGRLFGFRSSPKLLEVDGDGSPMLVGIFRPVILMPATTLGRLSISEQKMVLGHELAHVKRRDLLWSMVVAVVRAVFFFHPLVWLGQRRVNLLQEMAADELAISRQKHDPVGYGKLLVSAVGKFGPARLLSRMSAETVGSVETLTRRLNAMNLIGKTSVRVIVASGVLLAGLLAVGVVPWRLVAAEPRPANGLPPLLAASSYGALPKGGPWLVPEATLPGSEQKQGQQFFAAIQVSRSLKGKPKTALTKAPRMLHGSNFADFSTGDISRCLRVTVGPSPDKKLLEHIIEVKVIHDPKGKNPVVLTAKKITLADGKTGTVSVVDADGSEIEVEATMMKLRTGNLQPDDNTSSDFVPTADEAKAIAEIKKLGGEVGDDQMPSSEPGITVIFGGTKSTDAGLAHIAGLTRLLVLLLDGSQVTDAGLAHIAGPTELWCVSLGDTQVTDAGLVHLVGLKELRSLSLTGTQVTDAGLKQIAGLTQVESLFLDDTKVTDAGLAHLVGLKKLRRLSLTGTQVTDAGLKQIAGLTQLEVLSLDDTKVTDAGVAKLRKALPKCEIVWP